MTTATEGRIEVRRDSRGVATVVIDNAARLNALGSALLTEFAHALARLGEDQDLRAVVVTGAGERAFIGGADIREMGEIDGPDAARAFITGVHRACAAVRACPVPVIARIQGYCFGAGLELAAACDVRIASEMAELGMPEVRLGIPSVVEAALLPTLIGWGRTRRLLLTGETIDAEAALAWGLVEEVAPAAEMDAAVEACVADILACGPAAIRAQKSLIAAWETLPLGDAIAAGIEAFADAYRTDEPKRMMTQFLAARTARKSPAA
ncbi:MAG TPA: enoyl-CoA hydratase [Caulobacteraceae bacterium]|jgi:enoyl-CoA hydratase/carnithine racemase|nr:enoyl-CoA hydratase [Caulobacteraceae bacterium]